MNTEPPNLPDDSFPLALRLFGVVPLGIGVTVLGFLWSQPFGEFGSPPLFFRIFGSFVALGFVLFGINWVRGTDRLKQRRLGESGSAVPTAPGEGYVCPSCAAPLAADADVSPLGDVKCPHCGRWFNIHGKQA